MEEKMCNYWKELDDDNGNIYEYCRKHGGKCVCGSNVERCLFTEELKK